MKYKKIITSLMLSTILATTSTPILSMNTVNADTVDTTETTTENTVKTDENITSISIQVKKGVYEISYVDFMRAQTDEEYNQKILNKFKEIMIIKDQNGNIVSPDLLDYQFSFYHMGWNGDGIFSGNIAQEANRYYYEEGVKRLAENGQYAYLDLENVHLKSNKEISASYRETFNGAWAATIKSVNLAPKIELKSNTYEMYYGDSFNIDNFVAENIIYSDYEDDYLNKHDKIKINIIKPENLTTEALVDEINPWKREREFTYKVEVTDTDNATSERLTITVYVKLATVKADYNINDLETLTSEETPEFDRAFFVQKIIKEGFSLFYNYSSSSQYSRDNNIYNPTKFLINTYKENGTIQNNFLNTKDIHTKELKIADIYGNNRGDISEDGFVLLKSDDEKLGVHVDSNNIYYSGTDFENYSDGDFYLYIKYNITQYNVSEVQTVYVPFKINVSAKNEKLKLTVNFVDENGNKIKESTTESLIKGTSYVKYSEYVENYELISTDDIVYGTLESDTEINFTYKKIEKETEKFNLTTDFVDENGDKIKDSTVESLEKGTEYSKTADEIDGYELTSDKTKNGTLESDTTISFKYKKVEKETEKFNLTVNYVDENGNKIKESSTESLEKGTKYSKTADEIDGYELTSDKTQKGTLDSDTTINFTYKKVEKETEKFNLTTDFVDENGDKIKESNIESLEKGTEYSKTADEIDGYELTSNKTQKGTLDSDTTINFTYKKVEKTTDTSENTEETTTTTDTSENTEDTKQETTTNTSEKVTELKNTADKNSVTFTAIVIATVISIVTSIFIFVNPYKNKK